MARSSLVVLATLLALVGVVAPAAHATRVTVYDSEGFDAANLGPINGQRAGTWHATAGAKTWSQVSGQASDGAQVIDVGGSHGKVLSFPATGNWADTRLRLDWRHWNVADFGRPAAVRWDFDFIEYTNQGARAMGEVLAYRNDGQVQQLSVHTTGGDLRLEARPHQRTAPWEPSHLVERYSNGEWHHLTVIQDYAMPIGTSEEQGELHVYLDGWEVTAGSGYWYTVWAGYVGYISDLAFGQMVQPGARLYVDNVVVRTGQWAETLRLPEERVQVFNAEGFERSTTGPIHGQRVGRWYRPNSSRLWTVTSGSPSDGGTIVPVGDGWTTRKGKVLSFPGTGRWATTALSTKWTGGYGQRSTVVRTDLDFRQTAGCYGAIETMRNDGQVVQAQVGVENGTLELFGRKNSPSAPIETHALAQYDLSSVWHSLAIEQHQPATEGLAQIKVFLDDREVTRGATYYGQWAGWPGYVDQVRFGVGCNVGALYQVDDLSVVEGPTIHDRPLPVNWLWFWGDDVPQQRGWANTVMTRDLDVVSDAGDARMATVFDMAPIFFTSGNGQAKLRHDYQLAWQFVADLIKDQVSSGQIIGFILPDEPLWNCLREADLATAASEIHGRFPEAIVYVNEAAGPVMGSGGLCSPNNNWSSLIPADIDWFSIDSYGRDGDDEDQRLYGLYNSHIFPRLAGRKTTIVNGSFSTDTLGPDTRLSRERRAMNAASETMIHWAMRDRRVIAMDPYLWPNGSPGYQDDLGTANLPTLRGVWESIGKVISENNPRPSYPKFFPTQGFDSISTTGGRQPLPSTYAPDPWAGGIDPIPPDPARVYLQNAAGYSQPNALRMVRTPDVPFVDFRYVQGTDRNPHGDTVRYDQAYVDFKVKPDDASRYAFEVWPIRGDSALGRLVVSPDGIALTDGTGSRTLVAGNQLSSSAWRRLTVFTDRPNRQIKIWVDGSLKFSGALAPLFDLAPNTVHFRNWEGAISLDDIGFGAAPPF